MPNEQGTDIKQALRRQSGGNRDGRSELLCRSVAGYITLDHTDTAVVRSNPFEKIPSVDEASLVCKVGDRFIVKLHAVTEEGESLQCGDIYVAVQKVGSGWDFDLVKGVGAKRVRMLNSRVLQYLGKAPEQ